MPAPHWDGSPNRYEPNPVDDRALAGTGASEVYLSLATAIEQTGEVIKTRGLPKATRRAVSRADGALRLAAYTLVMYMAVEAPNA